MSPRTLAWSAAAAGLAIVLQAGLLAGLLIGERGATYQTASYGEPATIGQGAFALVRFNPTASIADITKFFDSHKASWSKDRARRASTGSAFPPTACRRTSWPSS